MQFSVVLFAVILKAIGLAVVACGCKGEPLTSYIPPPLPEAGPAIILSVEIKPDAAAPPGFGPVDSGAMPPRACTGARKSGVAVLCVRAGEASRIATIKAAVKSAKNGDVIQVAAGTYAEDLIIQDKALTLAGGFDPTFKTRNLTANESRIKGSGGLPVLRVVLTDGKSIVIDGFTITGGGGDSAAGHSGAGILSHYGNATFSNNRIVQNQPRVSEIHMTDTRGGGIWANGSKKSSVRILHNVIDGNVSGRGGGIASSGVGSVVIEGNVIRKNRGYSDHGGGLFVDSPDVAITGNLIDGNEIGPTSNPYGYGGGVYLHSVGTSARMSFNVITNNVAVTVGSGVFVDNGAHASLSHELIYGNKCSEAGGSAITVDSTDDDKPIGSIITVDHSTVTAHDCPSREHGDGILIGGKLSRATVTDSIFWDNGERPFNFARTADAPPLVTHSWTSGDPGFLNASQHDYHLRAGSPAAGYGAF